MTLIATHFPNEDRDFNHGAAEAVYGAIMKMDADGAALFARMVVGGAVQYDLIVHEEQIADEVRAYLDTYGEATRSNLTRSFLSKRASGEDVEAVVAAAGVLAKAFSQFDYTPEERARRAHQQQRDLLTGRFVVTHHNINYPLGRQARPLSDPEAKALGIPIVRHTDKNGKERAASLTSEQKQRYQTAYHQVQAVLAPYRGYSNAVMHLNYGPGNEIVAAVPAGTEPIAGISPYKHLQSVSVSVLPSAEDATTSPYDTLKTIGGNMFPVLDGTRPNASVHSDNEDYSSTSRVLRRLHSGSAFLEQNVGGAAGPNAELAFKVGRQIGTYGPEAQRVLGPTVDRAAYRYRGTEREPDRRVTEAFAAAARQAMGPADAVRADRDAHRNYEAKLAANRMRRERAWENIRAARAGDTRSPERREIDMHAAAERARQKGLPAPASTPTTGDRRTRITISEAYRRRKAADERFRVANKQARKEMFRERRANAKEGVRLALRSNAAARRLAIHGTENAEGIWNPSAVLSYFKTRLPNPELNSLQLKSGTVPPSEGVLLDRRGQLVTQAVGYGDDWYLPFNLNHLSKLRGGEYIRTRTWGGPTTEDVYTGLAAGARSLTVVSHNGVYNMEFDPSFKGGRRYNDKAARMVGRYGHLLDTVKGGRVTNTQVDQSRMVEIESELEDENYTPDTKEFNEERTIRLAREAKNPTFSAAQRAAAASTFLEAEALKTRTADGHETTGTEMVNDWLDHQANAAYIAHRDEQKAAAGENFTIPGAGRPVGLHGQAVAPEFTPAQFKAQIAAQAGLSSEDPGAFAENAIAAMGLSDRFDGYVDREQRAYAASLKPLELNGEGYLKAMQALQEQFPYYISNVSYHPWTDAKRGIDTGYVNHGTNRPALAQAGYFAAGAGAAGAAGAGENTKVAANSIRFQNGKERPVSIGGNATPPAREEAEGAPAPAGAPERAPASAPASALKGLQHRADLGILTELWGQTHISSGVHHPEGVDMSGYVGKLASTVMGQFQPAAPALAQLRGTGDLNFWTHRLDVDPEGTHRIIERAVKENQDFGVFELDPQKLVDFYEGGMPAPTPKFKSNDASAELRGIGTDRDYSHPAYRPGANAKAVATEYRTNTKISSAVRTLGLPASVSDPHFDVAAQGALDKLRAQENTYLDWVKRGQPRNQRPVGMDVFAGQVEALSRATQLRTRYQEASTGEQAPHPSPPSMGPGAAPTPPSGPPAPPTPTAPASVGFTAPAAATSFRAPSPVTPQHRGGHLVLVA